MLAVLLAELLALSMLEVFTARAVVHELSWDHCRVAGEPCMGMGRVAGRRGVGEGSWGPGRY